MPGFLLALLAIYYANIMQTTAQLDDVPSTEEIYESLIGGEETALTNYPEMVYLVNERGGRCSGAIVGPQVILTAAHCIYGEGNVRNYFDGPEYVSFDAVCETPNAWKQGRIDYDFALCKSTKGRIAGAKPATMGRRFLKKGDKITMAGFGCTSSNGYGGNNGILKTGPSQVDITTTSTYNYFYAFNEPILCFGDSGGPVYSRLTNPLNQRHIIFGVNSRTNLISLSVLASTYTKPAHNYIASWAKRNKVGICGINMKCKIAGLSAKKSNTTIEQIEEVNYDADDESDDDV